MNNSEVRYRREVLGAAGSLALAMLSGCSSETQDTEVPNESRTMTESPETGTPTNNSSTSTPESQEIVHEGEEEWEEWLSSHEDLEGLPESHWMEFENPADQFNLPLTEYVDGNTPLAYNIQENAAQGIGDFDSLYIALPKDSEELQLSPMYFSEEEWDPSISARENIREVGRLMLGGYTPISQEDLNSFFEEDVGSYSDVSSDFPQEYLELIDE